MGFRNTQPNIQLKKGLFRQRVWKKYILYFFVVCFVIMSFLAIAANLLSFIWVGTKATSSLKRSQAASIQLIEKKTEYSTVPHRQDNNLCVCYYAKYAHASKLISQGRKAEALSCSYSLKKEMLDGGFTMNKQSRPTLMNSLLYGFNLIRIAFLAKDYSTCTSEYKAWIEVEAFLQWGADGSIYGKMKVSNVIIDNFLDKKTSLKEFIQRRKAHLSRCCFSN